MPTMDEIQEQEKQAKLNVKPGDKWFRMDRYNKAREVEVTKVTKTQITFSDNERMSRVTGKMLGHGDFYSAWYLPATDALRAEVEQTAKIKRANADLQEAIARAMATSGTLPLDKKVELTNLLTGFFNAL